MWSLRPTDLLQFKGAGGQPFAHFVDRLIRAEAASAAFPQSEIGTQLRNNVADGGVDTQVKQPIATAKSGWFAVPTCWQFKAQEADDIDDKTKKKEKNDLQKEINKPFVTELIKQGYGYRMCLLGDLPASKADAWEKMLKAEALRINKNAPDPRIISGGHLLEWAQRFPGVIQSLRNQPQGGLHWEAWAKNRRAVTPSYIANPEWLPIRKMIIEHVDFGIACADACMPIGGAAGVGKTRLVFESLAELPQAASLVVVADDEQTAKQMGNWLANSNQVAIVVADECSARMRFVLNACLSGHRERVRVIAIDNAAEPVVSAVARVMLSSDAALKNAEPILRENFPAVPDDRRRQYVNWSRGFIRLAADMCQHDAEISSGEMGGLLGTVERYVRHRLGDNLAFVAALALFHNLGFRDDVVGELDIICMLTGLAKQRFHDVVRLVRETPGFVVQAGRYWYVTPEIVARILFAEGWQRFVAHDIGAFLQQLPKHLQQQVPERIATHATDEVRRQFGAFFRTWFRGLSVADLAHADTSSLTAALVETLPSEYLPLLRSIIENASPGTIAQIEGYPAHKAPRRSLVWLLERLVSFSEYFEDCEACLFRLAAEETELRIGNNATNIWAGLFSICLSGTAIPFRDRAAILKKRLLHAELGREELWSMALAHLLRWPPGRLITSGTMVAGRLIPNDWQPASTREARDCLREGLMICGEQMKLGSSGLRKIAFEVIGGALSDLLSWGLLDDLREIVTSASITAEESREFLHRLDGFIFLEQSRQNGANTKNSSRLDDIRKWSDEFRSNGFSARLREICSESPWNRHVRGDEGRDRTALAQALLEKPALLSAELDWLASPESQLSQELGFDLGRFDKEDACGQMIIEHAVARKAMPLLRGYIQGMVLAERSPSPDFLRQMTYLEEANPEMAIDMLVQGGDGFDAVNRLLHLVDSRAVSARYLSKAAGGVGRRQLSCDEVRRILPYFVRFPEDKDAVLAGVRFLVMYLHLASDKSAEGNSGQSRTLANRPEVWTIIERALPLLAAHNEAEWVVVVEKLASVDSGRAAQLLGQAMLSEDVLVREHAQTALARLAKIDPASAMAGFGAAVLNHERGWILRISECREIIRHIPTDIVLRWARNHGVKAAAAIARHLPVPYVEKSGRPVVPDVVDALLRDFDDDEVFHQFLAGSHSHDAWYGDGTDQIRKAAADAGAFLHHPNPRIREWAKEEASYRHRMAEFEEQRNEERYLPTY